MTVDQLHAARLRRDAKRSRFQLGRAGGYMLVGDMTTDGPTVTSNIASVARFIAYEYACDRFIYVDTNGTYDAVAVEHGEFLGFIFMFARDAASAAARLDALSVCAQCARPVPIERITYATPTCFDCLPPPPPIPVRPV